MSGGRLTVTKDRIRPEYLLEECGRLTITNNTWDLGANSTVN